jgi:hypothetical protein
LTEKKHYLRDLAESFVNVDQELETRLRYSADCLGVDMPDTPLAVIYGILREGAVVYKFNELMRSYEEAKREADNV